MKNIMLLAQINADLVAAQKEACSKYVVGDAAMKRVKALRAKKDSVVAQINGRASIPSGMTA